MGHIEFSPVILSHAIIVALENTPLSLLLFFFFSPPFQPCVKYMMAKKLCAVQAMFVFFFFFSPPFCLSRPSSPF